MKYRHKENEFGFSANSVLAAALGIGHEARMFNGKSKVFLKIGIYSIASRQAKWGEGGSLGK